MIAYLFQATDVDQAAYDGLMKGIHRESLDAPVPTGFIAHLSGPRQEGGWRVVDLWESEEAAERYYGSEVFRSAVGGAPYQIERTAWPMHRIEVETALKHQT